MSIHKNYSNYPWDEKAYSLLLFTQQSSNDQEKLFTNWFYYIWPILQTEFGKTRIL